MAYTHPALEQKSVSNVKRDDKILWVREDGRMTWEDVEYVASHDLNGDYLKVYFSAHSSEIYAKDHLVAYGVHNF